MFKRVLHFVVFALIVFSLVFGGTGTLRLGPFSLRHICAFVLFLYVCIWIGRKKIVFSPVLKFYLIYLSVYTVANILNGEFFSHHFAQSIYTYHLPCVLIVLTFPLMIKNGMDLSVMTKAIICLYIFNAVITIMQYKGISVAWEIGRSIADITEERVEALDYINSDSSSLFGYALASGMIGFSVTNGYIIASYFPLLSKGLYSNNVYKWFFGLMLITVAIIAAYTVQQRTAFFLILLYVAFLALTRSSTLLFVVAILLPVVYLFVGDVSFNLENLGRLHDIASGLGTRRVLLSNFESFLNSEYVLFGGYDGYTQHFGLAQHNALLSAWVLGGFFNFVCFGFFYAYLLFIIISTVRKALKESTSHVFTIVYGASSFIYLLYSLTHSDGVQNGSPMFWIVFMLFLVSTKIENSNTSVHV